MLRGPPARLAGWYTEVACEISRCAGAPTPVGPGKLQKPKYGRNSNCVRILRKVVLAVMTGVVWIPNELRVV